MFLFLLIIFFHPWLWNASRKICLSLITLSAINTCMYMYLFALIHPHNTQYNYAVSLVDNAMGVVEGSFVVVIGSFSFCSYILICCL